jgi:hypothetical protein
MTFSKNVTDKDRAATARSHVVARRSTFLRRRSRELPWTLSHMAGRESVSEEMRSDGATTGSPHLPDLRVDVWDVEAITDKDNGDNDGLSSASTTNGCVLGVNCPLARMDKLDSSLNMSSPTLGTLCLCHELRTKFRSSLGCVQLGGSGKPYSSMRLYSECFNSFQIHTPSVS